MEWLNNLTSGENGSAINLVLITLAIAILLIVIVWIFRKITGTAARRAMRSRVPRLSITDSTTVDDKRYLVMVRRDNVEHLLLIGGSNDLVVESNIVRTQTSQKQPTTAIYDNVPKEQDVVEEEQSLVSSPLASATAVGAAGLAVASAAGSSVAETVSKTASDASNSIADTASDITQSVTDTASSAVSGAVEQSSEAIDAVVENISLDIEPELETVEVEVPEVVEVPEIPEVDLESTISAQLDDALSVEALEIDLPETPEVETQSGDAGDNNSDDEMERLLKELSGESKEPAQ